MFCPNCGNDLHSRPLFCPSCGTATKLQEVPIQPIDTKSETVRRRKGLRPGGIIGILVALLILAIWLSSPSPTPAPTLPSSGETPTSAPPSNETVATKHTIGEEFSVGYWTYRCDGATWMSGIPTEYNELKFPDAAFLVVKLYVRNDDKSPSTLPTAFKLVDEQGREYNKSEAQLPESYPPFYLKGGSFSAFKQLNPGVSATGAVVFDVPKSGKYSLKVSGGYEVGEYALIDLSGRSAPTSEDHHDSAPTAISTTPLQAAEDSATTSHQASTDEIISIDATSFLAAYQSDETAANTQYKDRKISVTGVLSGVFIPPIGISMKGGLPLVTMGGPQPTSVAETLFLPGITAYSESASLFGHRDATEVADQLKIGETVTLVCTCGEAFRVSEHGNADYSVTLKDCTLDHH